MKSLKRLLVTILTAAMVVNTIPVSGSYAFAAQTEAGEEKISTEEETSSQEQLTEEQLTDDGEETSGQDEEETTEAVESEEEADSSVSEDSAKAADSEEEIGQVSEDKLDDGITHYGIWIGSEEITSANYTIVCGNGSATYDPSTRTITFNNANRVSGNHNKCLIYIDDSSTSDVTIDGNLTLYGDVDYGIYSKRKIVLRGTIDIEADTAILSYGTITINATSIKATSTGSTPAIYSVGADIVLKDGNIEATGGDKDFDMSAIFADGNEIKYNPSEIELVVPADGAFRTVNHCGMIEDGEGWAATYVKITVTARYDLWVGKHQVTSKNKDNIPVTGGGTAKYNPATKTLSFEGNVTGVDGTYIVTEVENYLIYSEDELKITGDVTLSDSCYASILCSKDLLIDGTVKLSSGEYGIIAEKNLTLKGNVTVESNDSEAILAYEEMVINTDSLSATSNKGKAINSLVSISIRSGVVRAKTESGGAAILSSKTITMADGLGLVKPFGGKVASGILNPADTRAKDVWIATMINSITATSSDIDSIPGNGADTNNPTFTVTGGAPAYFTTNGWWEKKNGSTWEGDYDGKFDAGTYRYKVQIMIDGSSAADHVLKESGVSVKVNGKTWTQDGSVTVQADMSHVFVVSPEYTVSSTPTKYDLWVGSTQVTAANKDNIPVTGGGKAVFNPSSK